MNRDNWKVGDEGIRPNGERDRCFYCSRRVGEQHALDCVIRNKTVVVEVTCKVAIPVPEDWGREMIDFHYNESTYCIDNLLKTLEAFVESLKRVAERDCGEPKPDGMLFCLCDATSVSYVRDATDVDEAAWGVRVADLPS